MMKNFIIIINIGILLCNLDELRKGNISEKFIDFCRKHNHVVIAFCDENNAYDYYKDSKLNINRTAVIEAFKDHYIYHYIYYTKPWRGIRFVRFYEMLRKTDIYYKFLEKYRFG